MTIELLELRSEAYCAAANYHRTAGEYFDALSPHSASSEKMPRIRLECLKRRQEYTWALEVLISYLVENEPASQELARAQRTIELLEHELRLELVMT
jgi:hypothetical protein